ncbi:MAG: zinc ribbon domain-containing protein [Oscillospiraceae bacterium]|nr:zinc ribbon domain-containing protein [Oscillospiraceae bacterium]
MKICANCNNQVEDNAAFCSNCGAQFTVNQQPPYNPQQVNYQMPPQPNNIPTYDPYDHTAEFDAQDISENKVISMLVYLMSIPGVIIALLASNKSKYAAFHVRQSLKFLVVEILSAICAIVLFWTIIVPIAYGGFMITLTVIKLICVYQICSGKAKEPAIIRSLNFLR